MAKITEQFIRDIFTKGLNVSEVVELINEEFERKDKHQATGVFARDECIYNYCPHPELCKDVCQCPSTLDKSG